MNGWYQVDCREVGTRRRRTFNLDELVRLSNTNKKLGVGRRKVTKARRSK
jgi:hypothetical protein